MKKLTILAMLLIFIAPTLPAYAYSELADDFLRECRVLDRPFPPEDWSNEDLRAAALEVLDTYEETGEKDWAVYFCIVTLGYTREADDIPRILEYEETMTDVVIRSLRGFPAPEAIECLLRWIESDRASFRELAVKSLMEIDFEELEESDIWRERVLNELQTARENETEVMIVDVIDEAIIKIVDSALEVE